MQFFQIINFFDTPSEESVIPLKVNYFELDFNVSSNAARNNNYVDADNIWFVNIDPIASFGEYQSTTICRKHLKRVGNAPAVCLMYEFLISSENSSGLKTKLVENNARRNQETDNIKKADQSRFHVRFWLKIVFRQMEDQEKVTYA